MWQGKIRDSMGRTKGVYASPEMFHQSCGRESRRLYAVFLLTGSFICPDVTFPKAKTSYYFDDE